LAEDGSSSSNDGHGRTGSSADASASGDVQDTNVSGTHGSKHEDATRQESGGADSASGTDGSSSDGLGASSGDSGSAVGDGSVGGDGSGGGSGSDGHSGSGDGGVLQTTSNPVVTVTAPSADESPAPVAPSPGDGG